MDGLTKGALGATVVLLIGAVAFSVSNNTKSSNLAKENEALRQQVLSEQRQRDDDRVAAIERKFEEQIATQRSDAENQLARLRAEMAESAAKAAQDRSVEVAEREALTETIAEKIRKEEEAIVPEPLTAEQMRIRDAVSIGQVTDVNAELGFIVVNAGSAQGLEAGTRFNVRRDKLIITQIEIDSVVDGRNSVANINPQKLQPGQSIQAGDDIIGMIY